ncbi:MAG: hypothetical protein AAGH88_07250 [Planctomycetota bacterium]
MARKPAGKFGPIKRQHGRVAGLDDVLDRLLAECPSVSKIVPGRMGRKRGKTPARLRVQYETGPGTANADQPATGVKCIYTRAGSWQEVFVVCNDPRQVMAWVDALG